MRPLTPLHRALESRHGAWGGISRLGSVVLIPAIFAALRLSFPPRSFDGYWINYALSAEAHFFVAHELFHPLYVLILGVFAAARHLLGFDGNSISAIQRLNVFGAMLCLGLVHEIVHEMTADRKLSVLAAALAAASKPLWLFSMQHDATTLSMAAILGCVYATIRCPASSLRSAVFLGAFCGAAAGLNTAALILVPVLSVEVYLAHSLRGRMSRLLAFFFAFGAVLSAIYLLIFWKIKVFAGLEPLAAIDALLSSERTIVTILQSVSVTQQWNDFVTADITRDYPISFILVFHGMLLRLLLSPLGCNHRHRRLIRIGVLYFVCALLFFLACDPVNWFSHVYGILIPILFALIAGRIPVVISLMLVAGVLAARSEFDEARFLPDVNPGVSEARFIEESLTRQDLLVSISQPDWLFACLMMDKVPIVKIRWSEKSRDYFGVRSAVVGEELNWQISRVLKRRGKVILASDRLFRDSGITEQQMKEHIDVLLGSFARNFVIGAPLISPSGSHYYPINAHSSGGSALPAL